MNRFHFLYLLALGALLLVSACENHSRRDEIEQRKEALKRHQDSSLLAAQQELAIVDSTLEAIKIEFEQKKAEVERHKAALTATAEELTALTMLGLRRDSLQAQWQLLGAKIRYIRQKQSEGSDE
ncbi:MAG: hypothetical protein IJ588_11790 [Prevotella sp.]|nr:hypothetical protein [Prevotella sp.]